MADQDLVYVYGWFASGKSTLQRLLDGHPQLAVSPIHDKFLWGFSGAPTNQNTVNFDDSCTISKFKERVLSTTGYNQLHDFHYDIGTLSGYVENVYDPEDDSFEYYEFEDDWIREILLADKPSHQQVLFAIFDSLFKNWGNYDYSPSRCDYFVGMGFPRNKNMNYLLREFDNGKMIYVYRDPRDCIASLSRTSISVGEYLKRGEIYKINEFHTAARQLRDRYPQRVHFVDFDDLIFNTTSTMEGISEFLDIESDPLLSTPTYCGNELERYEREYLGRVQETWESNFSDEEKQLADLQMHQETETSVSVKILDKLIDTRYLLNKIKNRL